MKGSTSESKPFQSRDSRLSQAERTAEAFQSTDSDAELFMYSIQGIRFGS